MVVANSPTAWDERARAAESWQAAMWSKEGQEARFEAVLRHVPLEPRDILLDFGCGTGRLREYLPEGVSYYGYDWSPLMRERAGEHPRGVILDNLGNLRFDHVVCIGTFNLADSWSPNDTGATLLDLWMKHANKTLSVSLYSGTDAACITYSPIEAISWARKIQCKRFVLDTSYRDNDFLMVMHR